MVEVATEALERGGRSMQAVFCKIVCTEGHLDRHRCFNATVVRWSISE